MNVKCTYCGKSHDIWDECGTSEAPVASNLQSIQDLVAKEVGAESAVILVELLKLIRDGHTDPDAEKTLDRLIAKRLARVESRDKPPALSNLRALLMLAYDWLGEGAPDELKNGILRAVCPAGTLSQAELDWARSALKAVAPLETSTAPLADRLAVLGYAPGRYYIRCMDCKEVRDGCDKLALRCHRCALARDAEKASGGSSGTALNRYTCLVHDYHGPTPCPRCAPKASEDG